MFKWLKSILRGNQCTNECLNGLITGLSSRSEDSCEIFPNFRHFRVVGPTINRLEIILIFRIWFWGFGVWGFGVLGFGVLGFWCLGFWGFGFGVLVVQSIRPKAFGVLGVWVLVETAGGLYLDTSNAWFLPTATQILSWIPSYALRS